jgi:class 3 adenylate cyclase/tetratricopeptide (TPR) repeat protein
MFCDLVGSTALSARLDPEDLRNVIGVYHRCCTELVELNRGFVAKYMGDGLLAYFGYPQAHEHDAERAVRTGLALVEAVPKLSTPASAPLHVRVGITTGLVVVGDLIGAGASQEQAVVGETPNLAARLQALAEPNAVVIGSITQRLIGGLFEYRDLGAIALKGFPVPVQAYQVVGLSAVESRFEALRANTTALVGRDEEIEILRRRWDQAKRGDGCVVLISGEPGIGKSRIAQDVIERLSDEPHTRLRYFCSPHHQDTALYPSIAQLERAAGLRREDTDVQRLDKLEAVLSRATNDLSEAAQLFADLLSIPVADRYPSLGLTPQKRKEKTLLAQFAQVEGLAALQPVLMVWEDVHWSDPTTRESLDLLIDRVPTLRVLVLITFRPEFAPPWTGRRYVTLLSLSRLSPRQRAEMIRHVTGGKILPKEIADQIIDRTDGVPLFIEELTKAVVESGALADAGDRYTLAGPLPQLAIPTSLNASLLARLDRLAPVREVAQIASALGRQFSHELISAVAPIPKRQLDDALEQLVHAELMFRRGIPPDAEYVFKHALVQDAAYSTLLRSGRQQIHARIAVTLEDKFPEVRVVQPALLAHHCTEAGLVEKAIAYRLKAGQHSVSHSAMKEAVVQLQKGLVLLPGLPDGPGRLQYELDFQMTIGAALTATQGYTAPKTAETYRRAEALAEQLDRSDCLYSILVSQWVYHLVRAELRIALSIAQRLEDIGATQNDATALLMGHWIHGLTSIYFGDFVTAHTLLKGCHGLRDPAHRAVVQRTLADDPYVAMLADLALTLATLGYIDQARLHANEGLIEASKLQNVFSSVVLLIRMCRIAWVVCSFKEMRRHAEQVVALSEEHGFPLWLGYGTILLGWSLTMLGSPQEGLALLTKGMSISRATGAVLLAPTVLVAFADVHARLGRCEEGLRYLSKAGELIESTDERQDDAELHRVRGDLMNASGDGAAAERSYHQALVVSKRQRAKIFELRAATSLARLWRDQGKRIEARDLLAPIYGWFTEGFDTPVLQDAKTLLDELA